MISLGYEIKLFSVVVIMLGLFSLSNTRSTWKSKSSTSVTGLVIHNYTESYRCNGYEECMYYMCLVENWSLSNTVTVGFDVPTTCRAPGWINYDPIIVSFLVIFSISTVLAICIASFVTVRDTQFEYKGSRPSNLSLRVIRAAIIFSTIFNTVQIVLGWYYNFTVFRVYSPLDVMGAVTDSLTMLMGLVGCYYSFGKCIKSINIKLDRVLGELLITEGEEETD